MSAMTVWYCGRCRHVLKCEPKWAQPKGCRCAVPRLPICPTIIYYHSRAEKGRPSEH